MADLIAQGEDVGQRWRRALPEGVVVVGRLAGAMSAPWDTHISRKHAELHWVDGELRVRRLDEARNPIFYQGEACEQFVVSAGEHFVIGATTFTLVDEQATPSDVSRPYEEKTYSHNFLQQVRFRNANQRIDVLSRLPEVIREATNDNEMLVRLVNILLAGLPNASAVAVAKWCSPDPATSHVELLHWDRRLLTGDDFRPSKTLIRRAVERKESVVHVWKGRQSNTEYTASENADWAYCTPLTSEAFAGWCIYISGQFKATDQDSTANDLRDDLKFTELAASTVSSIGDLRLLERQHAGLAQFFSPVVLQSLADGDPEAALKPSECDVSVLFCDLRGFSRRSEEFAHDLFGLLERVSRAMGVMTHHILEEGGVVGDFHGDSAMGFWGWPLAQEDAVERACRAALGIRRVFVAAAQAANDPLADFRMGIGIATGRAVAGKIGSVDQVKATVFGPVVNLAARLESMTKTLRASILLDEVSASILRETAPGYRLRRVARVRPYGLDLPLMVTELLPSQQEDSVLTDDHIAAYEAALEALHERQWPRAFELLHQVPARDRVKDFLTVFIAQHNRAAPPDWDGVIPLSEK